ncbi:MAG: hydroxymethylbilane synthase [Micrococcales bacterium]|nr:MAG: hydroxymethylbilane synthase [Micrococcales bacterium]
MRDAVISRDRTPLAGLPAGARVGTGSPRRAAQLLDAFPRLQIVQIRGNVQTRIDTIAAGRVDAVILAAAGLGRLDLLSQATQLLDPSLMVPAPGQAALAVECRSDDEAVVSMLSALEDPDTRAAVTAERALLTALEAGCSAPVGALAERYGADLVLRVAAGGPPVVRHVASGSVAAPADLGRAAADHLLNTSAGLTAREGGPAGTHYASSGVGS